jgi:hypothetical protein
LAKLKIQISEKISFKFLLYSPLYRPGTHRGREREGDASPFVFTIAAKHVKIY